MQPAPQIVVLAIGAAEEGAEAVELDALSVAAAPPARIAVASSGEIRSTLIGVEFVEALALEQRQGGDVVEGKAEIGEDQRAPLGLGEGGERLGQPRVGLVVERP